MPACVLALALLAPPPLPTVPLGPGARISERELLGRFQLTTEQGIAWPGTHALPMSLVLEPRPYQRFSLGFLRAPWRRLSFEAVAVAPPDATSRSLHSGSQPSERLAALTLRARVELPHGLSLQLSRTMPFAVANAPALVMRPRGPTLTLGIPLGRVKR